MTQSATVRGVSSERRAHTSPAEQPHKWISLVSRKCKKILKKFNLVITSQAKKSPQQGHNVHFDPNLEFKGLFMINLKLRIEFTTDQAYQCTN